MELSVEDVAEFYHTYHPTHSMDEVIEMLEAHKRFGTITVLTDEEGVSALLRFNIIGECVHVLDLIIRQGLERRGLIKLLTILSWHKVPYAKYFRFERMGKYPNRPPRYYRIANLLKG